MVSGGVSDKEEVEDLTQEFIAESRECLDRMERCLTTLEVRPDDPALVAEIFRSVHSIKGTTGFLGFGRLEALAHVGETLLGKLRDGHVPVTVELISGLLALLDGLRSILDLIDKTGKEGTRTTDDDAVLIALMKKLAEGNAPEQREGGGALPVATFEEFFNLRQPDTVTAAVVAARSAPEENGAEAAEEVTYAGAESAGGSERTLRVDVEVLNRMMNLVGELVLTRNQILQSSLDSQGFAQLGRRLNAVMADLRETVMQARMQPVGNVFSKFPRLVRDLAKTCGKKIRIEFAGQETGLDKSLLEAIKDPLTHAVRNAVDHGIELPSVRAGSGKGVEGLLRLRAFHQNGSVVIELADDGAGISVDRVRAKAVERGLVTPGRAEAMTDGEAVQMVFLPGFSTAETVTNLSGRGVGMDVVRSNVEKVGGSVELETRAGLGTTLRLRVPLTLAIIPALVVSSGGHSFALPQSALVELVYVGRDDVQGAIEQIGNAEVYRLRERLLPLVRLDRLLGIEQPQEDGAGFYLAVLEVDDLRFGLVLDDLLAPEEIVVKPLSLVLRQIGVFSGATVLGNGTLALILDVAATAARAGVSTVLECPAWEDTVREVPEDSLGERFLMFEGEPSTHRERRAIPLQQVERIENVPLGSIEYVGGRAVLQYGGEPLLLEDTAGILEGECDGQMATVLICARPGEGTGRRKGLVVSEVFHVAVGTSMVSDTETFGHVVLVEGKMTMVQDAFAPELFGGYDGMREVA